MLTGLTHSCFVYFLSTLRIPLYADETFALNLERRLPAWLPACITDRRHLACTSHYPTGTTLASLVFKMRDVYKEAEQYFKSLVAENPFDPDARDWLSITVAMQNEAVPYRKARVSVISVSCSEESFSKVIPFRNKVQF